MRYLFLRPLGGLTNRTSAMEAVYNYSLDCSSRLIILWEMNDILNARFSKCFQQMSNSKVIELSYVGDSLKSKIQRKLIDKALQLLLKAITRHSNNDLEIEAILKKEGFDLDKAKGRYNCLGIMAQSIYIETPVMNFIQT